MTGISRSFSAGLWLAMYLTITFLRYYTTHRALMSSARSQSYRPQKPTYLDVERLCALFAEFLEPLLLAHRVLQQSQRVLILTQRATPVRHVTTKSPKERP